MNLNKHLQVSPNLVWLGVTLVLATGFIHLIEAPDNYVEAAYKGLLFGVNGVIAIAASYGIFRQQSLGWWLGLLATGGALVMYVISRTIGLPGLGVDDDWFEMIGVASMLVEAGFVIVAGVALLRPAPARGVQVAH